MTINMHQNRRSRLALFLLTLLTLLVFTACGRNPAQDPTGTPDPGLNQNQSGSPVSVVSNLDAFNLLPGQHPVFEAQVSEFNLGSRVYSAPYGSKMPYDLKGLIGIPKGDGPFPVILLSHGSHSNDDESKRFDTGFDYLVEALAKRGFIAISLDLSKPYIWKYGDNDDREKSIHVALDHFDQLLKTAKGNVTGFPTDLTGKIDFQRIGLIGHSRGGETMLDIAVEIENKGYPVSAILSVAPTFFFPDRQWPTSDVAILVPEFDGDVVNLDGYLMLSALNRNTTGDHALVRLQRANHNFFNRHLTRNDASMQRSEELLKDQLSREDQESFLVHLSTEFFLDTLSVRKHPHLFDFREQHPDQMYGYDISVMRTSPSAVQLMEFRKPDQIAASGGTSTAVVTDAWFYKNDEVLIDTITAGDGPYASRPLLETRWTQKGSTLTLKPTVSDFSGHDALAITLVPDSAFEPQQTLTHQCFSIQLSDKLGNTSTLTLPEKLNALSMTPGTIEQTEVFDLILKYWSLRTPLDTLWVPLNQFKGIDLTQLETVKLIFDQTETGALYIESIRLE